MVTVMRLTAGSLVAETVRLSKMCIRDRPNAHNDFILSWMGNVIGFVGLCIVLGALLALVIKTFATGDVYKRQVHGLFQRFALDHPVYSGPQHTAGIHRVDIVHIAHQRLGTACQQAVCHRGVHMLSLIHI